VSTETWFRNPHLYIRELAEEGITNIVWDRGFLVKRRINPTQHAEIYFGKGIDYRLLLIGEQGTAELRPGYDLENPYAVYPTWDYSHDIADLEDLLANPVGRNEEHCSNKKVRPDERPVFGQEHRVIITGIPNATLGSTRKFFLDLAELQDDYPDSIIHIHNSYSYSLLFGLGLRSADIEPRTAAAHGKVVIPAGRTLLYERMPKYQKWVHLLNMRLPELAQPRGRCIYNIRSAVWAGKHYTQQFRFKTRQATDRILYEIDISSPDLVYKQPQTAGYIAANKKVKPGDKYVCDTCSLQLQCKYFREGAVCSVEGAEPTQLAKYFKTRNADQIIEGLGTIMAIQTRRLEKGLSEENITDELDPNVTKLLAQIFDQGTKLAKLIDPNLRGGTKVQVNVGAGTGATEVTMGSPRQFIASVVAGLEAQGIARADITPELVQNAITGMQSPDTAMRAIEGTVISSKEIS
jgi:hypothetical protein